MHKSYQYPLSRKPPRRRRTTNPNFIFIAAGVLVLGGLVLLGFWLSQPGKALNSLFATETPTPTVTFTPTITPVPTDTPTITPTPTETPTTTPSAPFTYTVQEGDSLFLIAEKFNLGEDAIALMLALNPYNQETGTGIDPITLSVFPGLQIQIPNPGMQLPTATPIPPDLPRGTRITYTVASGDSLALIAARFNSTEEAIIEIEENNLTDPNAIFVGQQLVIPVNLVTATPTRLPTSTPSTPVTP